MRDELLNGEILDTLLEAQVIVGQWVKDYNTFRPHGALGYRAPAPEAVAHPGWTIHLKPGRKTGGWPPAHPR